MDIGGIKQGANDAIGSLDFIIKPEIKTKWYGLQVTIVNQNIVGRGTDLDTSEKFYIAGLVVADQIIPPSPPTIFSEVGIVLSLALAV